jgi:uncharacterized protein YpmS
MDIQMIVLIALSVMLVIKIVYLVVKRPEDEHHSDVHHNSHHQDPKS